MKRCPDCKSNKVIRARSPFGPIICQDCGRKDEAVGINGEPYWLASSTFWKPWEYTGDEGSDKY